MLSILQNPNQHAQHFFAIFYLRCFVFHLCVWRAETVKGCVRVYTHLKDYATPVPSCCALFYQLKALSGHHPWYTLEYPISF